MLNATERELLFARYCSKVETAESTVNQQEYRCFNLLNEISCIPQAKITLVKKD